MGMREIKVEPKVLGLKNWKDGMAISYNQLCS
jgi:hypothetical protein